MAILIGGPSSGVRRGTSFPPSARTGDLFYRTDLNDLYVNFDDSGDTSLAEKWERLTNRIIINDVPAGSTNFVLDTVEDTTIRATEWLISIEDNTNSKYASVKVVALKENGEINWTEGHILGQSLDYEIHIEESAGEIELQIDNTGTVDLRVGATRIQDGKPVTGSIVGGGGSLQVQDEGSTVATAAQIMNFVGADVNAVGSGGTVTVYIPTVNLPSHFNTSDGQGTSTVSDPSTTNRNVPASPNFSIGDWTEGTAHGCLNGDMEFDSGIDVLFDDLATTISVTVSIEGAANVTHTTAAITGNVDVTQNGIRIRVTNFQAVAPKYKGFIRVNIDNSVVLPNSGRFAVNITHSSGGSDYEYDSPEIFYDSEPQTATASGLTIAEASAITKTLSGINYYDLNSIFDIGISDLDYLNADSYPSNFVNVLSANYGIANYNLTGADLTNWSTISTNVDASYDNSKVIDTANYRAIEADGKISARTVDWSNNPLIYSAGASILVDTYGITSTDINEYFDDEDKRKNQAWGSWIQHQLNASELMVQGGLVKRQTGDWTGYAPTNTANYSSSSEQFYYRGIRHVGTSHSNGLFYIGGVTESNITNDDIKIEISTDNVDWFNCNEEYTGGGIFDGDGCRINADTVQMPNLQFTLGTGRFTSVSTGPDGWGIYLRVSMPNGSIVECTRISITDWV